jgi:hypothetical protein
MIEPFSFFLILIACILGTYALTPAIKRFEAHQRGYNKGHEKGYQDGLQDGLIDGIRIGEAQRYRQGKGVHIDAKG